MIKPIQQIYGIYLNPHVFTGEPKKQAKIFVISLLVFIHVSFQIVLGSFAPSTIGG